MRTCVFVGTKQTICTQKLILLLSVYHSAHDFFDLKPMIASWNIGYRFSIHKLTFRNAASESRSRMIGCGD